VVLLTFRNVLSPESRLAKRFPRIHSCRQRRVWTYLDVLFPFVRQDNGTQFDCSNEIQIFEDHLGVWYLLPYITCEVIVCDDKQSHRILLTRKL